MLDKVFGHHATKLSLDERFTMLSCLPPPKPARPRRRSIGSLLDPRFQHTNRNLIEQIARSLDQQARRKTLRQRLGVPQGALRRFGSESNLMGLRSFGSFGNLSQQRGNWRGSNNNLSRASSFSNLYLSRPRGRGTGRSVARRGVASRGRERGSTRGVSQGRVTRSHTLQQQRQPQRARGRRGLGARGRGRGRGGARPAATPVPTTEELDLQLEQYMAGSRFALDKELDQYMSAAAGTEGL